jgi:hypothetical protein
MLRNKWFALPVILLAFVMFANAGPYTINVYATLGPNFSGSPSYNTFASNVIAGVQGSSTSGGSGPAAYNFISNSSRSLSEIVSAAQRRNARPLHVGSQILLPMVECRDCRREFSAASRVHVVKPAAKRPPGGRPRASW